MHSRFTKYHSFMQRPLHPSFRRVKRIWTGRNMGGQVVDGKKMSKKSSKTIDIVSYALKVSIDDVTCVFVFFFQVKKTFNVCELA